MAALVPPVLSLNQTTTDDVRLTWTDATDGTAPYTYDLHRSLTKGFAPVAGNRIAQATVSPYVDSAGVVPNTFYYYVVVVNDDAAAIANSNEVTAVLKSRGNTGIVNVGSRRR